jgi:hypothetical protein
VTTDAVDVPLLDAWLQSGAEMGMDNVEPAWIPALYILQGDNRS